VLQRTQRSRPRSEPACCGTVPRRLTRGGGQQLLLLCDSSALGSRIIVHLRLTCLYVLFQGKAEEAKGKAKQ
jgi:hypothetical protein